MKQARLPTSARKELKATALNIEFLVISVIQGMALQMLVVSVVPIFTLSKIEYWPYAVSGFIVILIFWSQSIIHALSFIDWPINLTHTFLYFLASFIEVITFTHIGEPLQWFIFGFCFLCVAGVLYLYDFSMIKRHKKNLSDTNASQKLYEHIHSLHLSEMKFLVPAAIVFNVVAIWLLYTDPTLFIKNHYHSLVASIQALFSIILLIISVYAFKNRSLFITNTYTEE